MKNSRKCPKCGSGDILFVKGVISHGVGANYANFIPTGFFRSVAVHRYVCGACGFTEEWIDREDLEQLKKKYPKADHENRPL